MSLRRLFLTFLIPLSFLSQAAETVILKKDSQRSINILRGELKRAAIATPDVVSLMVLNDTTLLVTGKKVGSTTLSVWTTAQDTPKEYQLKVQPTAVSYNNIQVQTDIKVVEISKSALKQAGFFLGRQTGNTTFGIGNSSALNGTSFAGELSSGNNFLALSDAFNVVIGDVSKGILGTISALNANGFAYTLAEPSLVTMSGHTATFLAGGEFPYPRSSNDGDISIDFKEFGVRLNLSPTVMENNRIMLKVAPEVSELNYSNSVSTGGVQVPGISVRRTDTTVQLGDGETFIISGLISSSTMKNSDRFPGLGDIPILGAFFSSSRLESNDKELMMVVTPHLVRPIAKGATLPPLPGEIYRNYDPDFFEMVFMHAEPEDLPSNIGFSN
ncbi:type II and III secretion system protein [Vibrio kanaloae]|uniref:Type II and III secretion system protein n=1 Tax=Vibrio kanaloae TaxID=170673 RepID=A0A4U1Z689_9VIBR|nr:pilus assembly protein N-terminal domain-containing protein [Vibrio kanaloae]TKF28939.1 type II and III secretion system protein [Vibrio kanaloae]